MAKENQWIKLYLSNIVGVNRTEACFGVRCFQRTRPFLVLKTHLSDRKCFSIFMFERHTQSTGRVVVILSTYSGYNNRKHNVVPMRAHTHVVHTKTNRTPAWTVITRGVAPSSASSCSVYSSRIIFGRPPIDNASTSPMGFLNTVCVYFK
jgi:hypothetical protein